MQFPLKRVTTSLFKLCIVHDCRVSQETQDQRVFRALLVYQVPG